MISIELYKIKLAYDKEQKTITIDWRSNQKT